MPFPSAFTELDIEHSSDSSTLRFGVVQGEGIGPSVIDAALMVLSSLEQRFGFSTELITAPSMHAGVSGRPVLDDHAQEFYHRCLAARVPILHGPAGGRYVYDLRLFLGTFVKLTPVVPRNSHRDASLLRPEILEGVDILLVRDNMGGLYQGKFGRDADGRAFQEASYEPAQVAAVLEVASRQALDRRGILTVVTKPGGVPTISSLWREIAEEIVDASVQLEFLEVDNACFQLGADPGHFDVITSPNMFGDVLGDTASVALGSRGLSYSANFSQSGFGVYQTAHGAAHDLAGKNVANPIAQVLSLAWMLSSSLQRPELGRAIEQAVDSVLARGIRTRDIATSRSQVLSTSDFARVIAEEILSTSTEVSL